MSELKGACVSISFESMLLLPNQVLFLIELSKNVSKYVKQMPEYLDRFGTSGVEIKIFYIISKNHKANTKSSWEL